MNEVPGTRQKALALNLGAKTYGTFAEIGGGQEVARWFFSVGGAAGTVAKTVSAYDMAVSDSIYGPAGQYVGRRRLEAMLEQEFAELRRILEPARGDAKCFFAFADTVALRGYRTPGKGRGWLGIRFQGRPREEPSEILIHAHFFDATTARQQETLGVLGVNLVHAAFLGRDDPAALLGRDDPAALIASLLDNLSRDCVEVDMIKLSGPAFPGVDNRLASLQLVEQGLTDAAMFTGEGKVVQPSEVLHKTPVLALRGRFRPPTRLTLDLLERARDAFLREPDLGDRPPIVLAEMTLRDLIPQPEVGHADFLARADILMALGLDVLISRFETYYRLVEYLAEYTDRPVGLALGLPALGPIFEEKYYEDLPGGILEAAGRLFERSVKVYVHPTLDPATGRVRTVEEPLLPAPWNHLQELLLEAGRLVPIRGEDDASLSIQGADVRSRLEAGDPSWEALVPPAVAEIIKARELFGWKPGPGAPR
jgi:hypothetical protein